MKFEAKHQSFLWFPFTDNTYVHFVWTYIHRGQAAKICTYQRVNNFTLMAQNLLWYTGFLSYLETY